MLSLICHTSAYAAFHADAIRMRRQMLSFFMLPRRRCYIDTLRCYAAVTARSRRHDAYIARCHDAVLLMRDMLLRYIWRLLSVATCCYARRWR